MSSPIVKPSPIVSHSHRVILFIPIQQLSYIVCGFCFYADSPPSPPSSSFRRTTTAAPYLINYLTHKQYALYIYLQFITDRHFICHPLKHSLTRLFWNGIVSCEFLIHVLCNHTHTKGHYTVPMYIWMSCLWVSCDLLVYIWGNGHSLTLSLI